MTMLDDTKIECYYNTHEGRKAKYSFPFNTKEEYLQWRTEWRKEYAKLSEEIRGLRIARKEAALDVAKHADIQSKKAYKRYVAHGMMEMRMAGKEYAIQLKKRFQKKAA